MIIGIDGSRAFLKNRTGIEEYSHQVIKHLAGLPTGQAGLRDKLQGHQVVLYVRKGQEADFALPEGWSVKTISWPRFWTQGGLSLEMLLNPVDALFVPAHTVPLIHPEKTAVTIHGLEYEFCPEAYSAWERFYMRLSIRNSCRWAKNIVSVSENTKKDLMRLYGVPEEKISVVYEGYEKEHAIGNLQSGIGNNQNYKLQITNYKPYLLFIGRIEERKNIKNIIEAFGILKEKHGIPHKLVLAGKPGYGYRNFKFQISNFKFKDEVLESGYVDEEEKWALLKNADCFVFPTLYEGFGIPILEAQSAGCPVVASNNSSIPEVAGRGAVLVDPGSPEKIAGGIWGIVSDEGLKNDIIAEGLENIKRFSWDGCASRIAEILCRKQGNPK